MCFTGLHLASHFRLHQIRFKELVRKIYNKQFKRDSARVAFLVCVGFGVKVQCGRLVIACFTP
ncbi:hypothetical protein DOE54_02545 [Vibrio cholerae]|nr:hypothetical protein DOE54_02545 [Vibrio cholerae]